MAKLFSDSLSLLCRILTTAGGENLYFQECHVIFGYLPWDSMSLVQFDVKLSNLIKCSLIWPAAVKAYWLGWLFCTPFLLIKVKLCAWRLLCRDSDLEDGLGQLSEALSTCVRDLKGSRKMCRVDRALVFAETSISFLVAGEALDVLP